MANVAKAVIVFSYLFLCLKATAIAVAFPKDPLDKRRLKKLSNFV